MKQRKDVRTSLFISPHLDDAALSCGGLIHQLVQKGDEVIIATICTADAPTHIRLSPTALRIHNTEWHLGDRPYVRRCEEDIAACGQLHAQYWHLGLLDAIYRHDAQGNAYYLEDFMGGATIPADALAQGQSIHSALHQHMCTQPKTHRAITAYVPLALGGHVDHLIVRDATSAVMRELAIPIVYYEDFPYAERDDALSNREVADKQAHLVTLSQADVNARTSAILHYQSQLEPVFHVENHPNIPSAVTERVRAYVAKVGGERYWVSTIR